MYSILGFETSHAYKYALPLMVTKYFHSVNASTFKVLTLSCLLWLVVAGEVPRRTRGSLIGMVNDREFGVSYLEANITDDEDEGSSTLQARLDNIPPTVGEW